MRKVYLSDQSGRWFDLDAAQSWDQETVWFSGPGRRFPAGLVEARQETLFRTAEGVFVLYCSHDTDSALDTYTEISWPQAMKWLIANGYQKDLPKLEQPAANEN
jgi:hypothetical protein